MNDLCEEEGVAWFSLECVEWDLSFSCCGHNLSGLWLK